MKLSREVQEKIDPRKPKGDANRACPVCGFAIRDHDIDERQYCRLP